MSKQGTRQCHRSWLKSTRVVKKKKNKTRIEQFHVWLQNCSRRTRQQKIGQLSSLRPGSIDSDSLSTLVVKWEQLGVPECDMGENTAEACARKKTLNTASKIPIAFIWLKELTTTNSVDVHLLWDPGCESVQLTSGWESNTVPSPLYCGCKDTQASFYLSFFFFSASSSITLKLVGRQKPSRLHLTGSKTNFKIVAKATGEQIWSHLD